MRGNSKGLTLLEVMVSLGLFAIGALVCLENYLLNIRNARVVNERQTAVLLAERQVEELSLKPEEKQAGSGSFPEPYGSYTWQLSFSDAYVSETEKLAYRVGMLSLESPEGKLEFLVPLLEQSENEAQ